MHLVLLYACSVQEIEKCIDLDKHNQRYAIHCIIFDQQKSILKTLKI